AAADPDRRGILGIGREARAVARGRREGKAASTRCLAARRVLALVATRRAAARTEDALGRHFFDLAGAAPGSLDEPARHARAAPDGDRAGLPDRASAAGGGAERGRSPGKGNLDRRRIRGASDDDETEVGERRRWETAFGEEEARRQGEAIAVGDL